MTTPTPEAVAIADRKGERTKRPRCQCGSPLNTTASRETGVCERCRERQAREAIEDRARAKIQHFNGLSPAEAERLAMLAEEAGEVIQAVGKVLRHGYARSHPDGGPDNRELLDKEVGDFIAVVQAMRDARDIEGWSARDAVNRWHNKLKFTHHQDTSHAL